LKLEEIDPKVDNVISDLKKDIEEQKASLKPNQQAYFTKLMKKIEKEVGDLKLKKAKGLLSSPVANTAAKVAENANGPKLRISELEGEDGKKLKEPLHQMLKAIRLVGKQTPVEASTIDSACAQKLQVHDEYKKFLLEKAKGIAARTKSSPLETKPAEALFAFSEPGTMKTSGFENMAECVGVPVCTINETKLLDQKYKDVSFAERLRLEVMRCLKSDLAVQGDGRFNFSGMIMIDDIHAILDQHLNPKEYDSGPIYNGRETTHDTKKMTEVQLERSAFLGMIKNLVDPAQTFKDPKSGFPINLSGINWVLSANSIPPELNQKTGDGTAAVGSRLQMYSVPYPDPKYRKEMASKKWDGLAHAITASGKRVASNCKQKLDELVDHDIGIYQKKKKRMGVRALFQFMGVFEEYVFSKATETAEGGEVDCASFSVMDRSIAFRNEYNKETDASLLAYDFTNKILKNLPDIENRIEKSRLNETARAEIKKLVQGALDESKPFSERRDKYKGVLKSLEFIELHGKRQDLLNQAPYSLEEVVDRFGSRFNQLLQGQESELKAWKDLTSEVFRKQNQTQKTQSNRIILVDPEPGSDAKLFEQLAEVFSAPLIKMDQKTAFRRIEPKWFKYTTDKVPDLELPIKLGSYSINYDEKTRLYVGRNQWDSDDVQVFPKESLGNGPGKGIPVTLKDLEERPKVMNEWLRHGLKEWDSHSVPNLGAGFIVIEAEDPEEAVETAKKLVNQSSFQFPQEGGYDQAVRDLRMMSVVVLPTQRTKITEQFNEKQKGNKEAFVIKLPGIKNDDQIVLWAEKRVQSLVKAMGFVPLEGKDLKQFQDMVKHLVENHPVVEEGSEGVPVETKLKTVEDSIHRFVELMKRKKNDIFSNGKSDGIPTEQIIHELLQRMN
jgi:hypothetical protein